MMMKKFFFILVSIYFLSSCNKDTDCSNSVSGRIHNYTLDGCTWMIEINNQNYEPVNLSEFPSEFLVDNKQVQLTYTLVDGGSICMAGPLIHISCMTEE